MWGEHIDSRTIDSRIWPRTAAIAERFWSPEDVRDVDDMYRRLLPISIELESLGLTHLQSGDAGLRELASTQQIDALRTFSSAFEPVSFSDRSQIQHTDQLTTLDSFVDAVRPDPPSRYWFEQTIKRFLADPQANIADRTALTDWFTQLAQAIPAVRLQMLTSPRLAAMSTRADQLLELTVMGRQALLYAAENTKAPTGWKATQLETLAKGQQDRQNSGLVHFVFLPPLVDLIHALPE